MVGLRPHEGKSSQQAQDIIDDLFDLALIVAAVAYDYLDMHTDADLLPKLAMAGAGGRAILRRIFRTFLGPRIEGWVKRRRDRLSNPPST